MRGAAPVIALALVAGVAAAIVANPRPPGASLEQPDDAAARSLVLSIQAVLEAAAIAEESPPDDAWAQQRLEDAWRTLGLVSDREQAQLDVGAGRRPPLMAAPPLAPGQPGYRAAFNRAALTYLRAAVPARDAGGARRALELIELGQRRAAG
jgi:hypothetical protein